MIYVFDLDGTLCPIGKPVSEKTVAGLRELEERGHRVALCSGKPTYYLCGMARQLGLSHPILIGENGGVIQLGVHLPPEHFYIVTNRKKTLSFFREKRAELAEKYKEQLGVYRRCLGEVIGLPVKQTLIYSFKLGETVEIQ